MFQNKDKYQDKKQFQINKNLGVNTVKNNIREFKRDVNLNQQNLEFQINKKFKNENVFKNLEITEVLNKEIDITTGKTKEFADYGIYTISGEPILSISNERINVI